MNYAYNIKVNLKEKLYNFYEWNEKDKIKIVNRIKIFFVSDKMYNDIVNMKVIFDKSFTNELTSNICLFSNDIDIVCTEIVNDKINKISKLDLIEEREILQQSNHKQSKIKYKLIKNENNYTFRTRSEETKVDTILKYIEKEKNNEELITYLYYEWFSKLTGSDKYNKLTKAIKGEYNTKHEKILEIIKLINA